MNESNQADDQREFERDLSRLLRENTEQLPLDVIAELNDRRQRALSASARHKQWRPIAAAAIVTLALTTWMALPTLQGEAQIPADMLAMSEADLSTLASLDMLASMDMLAVMADI